MSRALHIDLDTLRASGLELDGMGADAAGMLTRLRSGLQQEGRCWGSDRPGQTFAEGYEPSCDETLRDLDELVAALDRMGSSVTETARAFGEQDTTTAEQIRRAAAATTEFGASIPPAIGPAIAARPGSDQPVPSTVEPTRADLSQPDSTQREQAPEWMSPDSPSAPESPAISAAQQPTTEPRLDGRTATAPPASVPSTLVGATADHAGRSLVPTHNRRGDLISAPPNRSSTPWSRPVVETLRPISEIPWRATHSGTETPPATSTPRSTTPRGGNRAGKVPATVVVSPATPAPPRLSLAGFDSGHDHATGEIVRAVEILLARYPIPLRGIESAGFGGGCRAPLVLHRDRQRDTAAGLWLIVDRSMPTGSAPIPILLARGFGYALDMACGYRAHRQVQRTLIADYLRDAGSTHESLGQAVAGYRRWRSRFSARCFAAGSLDPGEALAEGFAEVEVHGDRAATHAQLLHHLLVAEWAATPRGDAARA